MNGNDINLLRHYAADRSEAAFTELVRRHVDLVYSAALRQVDGNEQHASDAAQMVFTDLARKASRLIKHPSLTGWLYTSTRYAAAAIRRSDQRRRARELEAHTMNQLLQPSGTEPDWNHIRPVLDEAMHELKADDREALLLRFFERLPLAEGGIAVGGE
jgi:RNA polymerase sigma factor (sigma-70 family)